MIGTSAGALNAWLVAGGADPEQLIARWLDPAAGQAIKFRHSRDLWNGYLDPAPLLDQTRRIHREFPRKLPLGVVSIEVPQFRPRLFCDDEVTPEQLLATCSILLFYPWVKINGRRLVDGGLFEPMPIWAAAEMGASRVIAINALPRITPWAIHAALSGMHRVRKKPVPESLQVNIVAPSGWMGTARDSMVWDRNNVQRWVEMGTRDGEDFVHKTFTGLKPLAG